MFEGIFKGGSTQEPPFEVTTHANFRDEVFHTERIKFFREEFSTRKLGDEVIVSWYSDVSHENLVCEVAIIKMITSQWVTFFCKPPLCGWVYENGALPDVNADPKEQTLPSIIYQDFTGLSYINETKIIRYAEMIKPNEIILKPKQIIGSGNVLIMPSQPAQRSRQFPY